jgi:hypothetical protein
MGDGWKGGCFKKSNAIDKAVPLRQRSQLQNFDLEIMCFLQQQQQQQQQQEAQHIHIYFQHWPVPFSLWHFLEFELLHGGPAT